jgi:4-amino-4-deoxy-L-arabinose transferase-like glycosyltransferase
MSVKKYQAPLVITLFLIALALRVYPTFMKALVFDEKIKLAIANEIDFTSKHLPIGDRRVPHSLMSVYFSKLGTMLFGKSLWASRFFFVVFGTASLFFIYLLVLENSGMQTALLTLILLVFDQFHISEATQIREEAPLLLFSSIAIYCFFKALKKRKEWIYGTALALGFSYLCKEGAAFFLLISFCFYVLTKKEYRSLFGRRDILLTTGIMAAVGCVYWLWGINNKFLNYGKVELGISLRALYMYFAEAVTWLREIKLIDYRLSDIEFHGFGFEHWVTGILIYTSFVYSVLTDEKKKGLIRFSLLMFSVFFIENTFLDPSLICASWRMSLSILPGLILVGNMLVNLCLRDVRARWITAVLIIYFIIRSFYFVTLPEHCYAVSNNDLCSFYLEKSIEYLREGEMKKSLVRAAWIKNRCRDKMIKQEAEYILANKSWPQNRKYLKTQYYCE